MDFELISHAPNSLQLPALTLAQLFANAFHVHVHRAGIAEEIEAPDLLQKLFPGEDLPRVGSQEVKELDLLGGHLQLDAVQDHGIVFQGDGQIRQHDGLLLIGGGGAAAEHRLDPGDELVAVEGLGDIVVRPQLQAPDPLAGVALGGEHDDRRGGLLSDIVENGPTIPAGQHHIQYHQRGLDAAEGG